MVPTMKIFTSRFLPELPNFYRCVPITVLGAALGYRTLLIFMQILGKFLKAFTFSNFQDEIFKKIKICQLDFLFFSPSKEPGGLAPQKVWIFL